MQNVLAEPLPRSAENKLNCSSCTKVDWPATLRCETQRLQHSTEECLAPWSESATVTQCALTVAEAAAASAAAIQVRACCQRRSLTGGVASMLAAVSDRNTLSTNQCCHGIRTDASRPAAFLPVMGTASRAAVTLHCQLAFHKIVTNTFLKITPVTK